ncbi:MAG: peroxide stress protein YaaA [Dorea sp.]|nr:peroxide stress protein YaaA [Dorea sp.]MDE7038271.1 peroxide stress protein YaaA [Lachnospiraceae bacterium]
MRIIISPAKKMNMDADTFPTPVLPVFLEETELLKDWIRTLSFEEAQALWNCNGKIAELNYRRFLDMDLRRNLTPALISYEGIQYQYMAPEVFTQKEWDYVQERLRILSGFYGVLKPLDGVVPYRLEMQAKAGVNGKKNLYEFWEDRLYQEVHEKDGVILNLASKEYSRCIEKYLKPEDTFITCVFGEWKSGKVIQKGTQAKMARGEMVRFMAERGIEDVEEIRRFDRLGYQFQEELSSDREYIFIRSV